MAPDDVTGDSVDDWSRLRTQPLLQKPARVAVCNDADVVAGGLVRTRKSAWRRLGPDRCFHQAADGEHGVRDLIRPQNTEHVGLVLVHVDGAMQLPIDDARVVT